MSNAIGNWLILLGIATLVIGLIAKTGLLSWFGHLPGDLHIKREGFQFYFPLASMIIVSIVLSALAAIIRRFM